MTLQGILCLIGFHDWKLLNYWYSGFVPGKGRFLIKKAYECSFCKKTKIRKV